MFSRRPAHAGYLGTVATLVLLFGSSPVQAIDITIKLDNPQNNPAYDSDGSGLLMIAEYAANYWEKLRPGGDSYEITIHWENFNSGNTIAEANGFDNSIRFKTGVNWFIDPTPGKNEEFQSFVATYYEDLDPNDRVDFFPGNAPPALLEIGYAADPLANGPANGLTDLLTLALHEIGHLTGIGWNALKPDVTIDSDWVGFRSNVKAKRENESHIMPDTALMDPFYDGGRTLPSALDIMVNAHEKGDSEVNLDRITYIGNVLIPFDHTWSNPFNWLGGNVPTSNDEVLISNSDVVEILTDAFADQLLVNNSASLLVKNDLQVDKDFTIGGNAEVQIHSTGDVSVGSQLEVDGGKLLIEGGNVQSKTLNISNGGEIEGYGTIGITESFSNRGFLTADGGTLTFQTLPGVQYDLDGSGIGRVHAINGDIALGNGHFDEFNGTMMVGEGHQVSFRDFYLKFGVGGLLQFRETNSSKEALFTTDPLSQFTKLEFSLSDIEVNQGVQGRVRVDQIDIFGSQVLAIRDNATLTLEGGTYFYGGTHTEAGDLVFEGALNIVGDTTLDFHKVDLDGEDGNQNYVQVYQDQTLTVNAVTLGPTNSFDGIMRLENNATAEINLSGGFVPVFTLKGDLEMAAQSELKVGSAFMVNGNIDVEKGTARIDATTIFFNPGSQTTLHDGAVLEVQPKQGKTVYDGGVISTESGDPTMGQYRQVGKGHVTDHTTITVEYFNWDPSDNTDSSTIIDARKTLEIIAGKIGSPATPFLSGRDGFGDVIDINGGRLDVTVGGDTRAGDLPNVWKITEPGVLNLNYVELVVPKVLGSHLMNLGTISGTGEFENVVTNFGDVVVGHEMNLGAIVADELFTLTSMGSIKFELAGNEPFTGYDQFISHSLVDLGGELEVALLGNFIPTQGQVFRIIDATLGQGVKNQFDSLILPFGEDAWDVIYGDNFVDLRFTAVPELGPMGLLSAVGVIGAVYQGIRRRQNRG